MGVDVFSFDQILKTLQLVPFPRLAESILVSDELLQNFHVREIISNARGEGHLVTSKKVYGWRGLRIFSPLLTLSVATQPASY
jgi:hypothetical protein